MLKQKQKSTSGKHIIHEQTNNNGNRIYNMAAATGIIIISTKHKHPKKYKITWTQPGYKSENQIDQILISKESINAVKDVKTYRGISFGTEHYIVIAKIKEKNQKKNN